MKPTFHPLHALLLAGAFPLFLGVLLTDFAYYQTFEIQWKNFASWLIVGALLFGGLALLWAIVETARVGWRAPGRAIYFVLLALAWVLGLVNAFVHSGDAWASMPQGLVIAVIDAVLVTLATGVGFFLLARGAA
ncbi:MAG TPA: DUF2231 domain-containing protein [Steroidobacteraceae bacterium]|nr:DUF2231 domain-containing protein [Steroidobacteraceae bacterium]